MAFGARGLVDTDDADIRHNTPWRAARCASGATARCWRSAGYARAATGIARQRSRQIEHQRKAATGSRPRHRLVALQAFALHMRQLAVTMRFELKSQIVTSGCKFGLSGDLKLTHPILRDGCL
jgi:hypothetical protein